MKVYAYSMKHVNLKGKQRSIQNRQNVQSFSECSNSLKLQIELYTLYLCPFSYIENSSQQEPRNEKAE